MAFEISRDGGMTWSTIAALTTTTSTAVTHQWLVTGPPTAQARIRARWIANPTVFDVSDANFAIIPRITVTAPKTPVTWGAGSTRTVTWTYNVGTAETVDIAFRGDVGATWATIASGVVNATATTGTWTGPMPEIGLIRISQSSQPENAAVGNVAFAAGGRGDVAQLQRQLDDRVWPLCELDGQPRYR